MKQITAILGLVLSILMAGALAIQAPGTLIFSNGEPDGGLFQYRDVNAPFFNDQGVPLAGSDYLAELYFGTTPSSLAPLGNPIPFTTGGHFEGNSVTLPGTFTTEAVWVQVRAWAASGGSTYEQARSDGAWSGLSNVLYVPQVGGPSGGSPIPPTELIGLQFLGVPEPSSLMLGLMGLAGLIAFSRSNLNSASSREFDDDNPAQLNPAR